MIPFIDLAAQYAALEKHIRDGIDAVLAHGKFIMGPEIDDLETRLAEFTGVHHCISCSSGTDGLLMTLMAKGVGPGDAVLTTPFSFIATAEVAALLGAVPVFVDIDPETFNLNPQQLEITLDRLPETHPGLTPRVVISVDLFGLPADYEAIDLIAGQRNLFTLEDAAQGFGGVYRGRRAGALAEAGVTSFFPAKPLGCYGDGGAIFTNDDNLAKVLQSIRAHGKGSHKYLHARVGVNGRLDSLQAAILLAKLPSFPGELEARNRAAARYALGLKDSGLRLPVVPEDRVSAWAQYSVMSSRRRAIQDALGEAGIPTAIYYPQPLHLQPVFAHLGYKPGDMPVSEHCAEEIFSLPMHPYLENAVIDRICHIIRSV